MNKKFTQKENQIKIYYFEFNGRALISKAILYYLKIPFISIKYTQDEWQNVRTSGKFEFYQLPALEMNNKIYVQSSAIEIFLARKNDLMGENYGDEWNIISLICSKNDLITFLRPLVRADLVITENERENLINNILPLYIKIYEKRLNSS